MKRKTKYFLGGALFVIAPVAVTVAFSKYKRWLKQEKVIRELQERFGSQLVQRKPSKCRDSFFIIGMTGELFYEIFFKSNKKESRS